MYPASGKTFFLDDLMETVVCEGYVASRVSLCRENPVGDCIQELPLGKSTSTAFMCRNRTLLY